MTRRCFCGTLSLKKGGDKYERKEKEYRTQVTIIKKEHFLYNYCSDMSFKSKNLYNRTNYLIRQERKENENNFIGAFELNKQLKNEECFKALPSKTSQQIVIQLCNNWRAWFKSIKAWKKDSSKYTGSPNPPQYKDKTKGKNIVMFDYMQGCFKDGKYYFPRKDRKKVEYVDTLLTKENFVLCRIVPYGSCYKIEMIYKVGSIELKEDNDRYLAIDLGVTNFATLTNNIGSQSIVINGRILKSINNYYNKQRAKAQSHIGRGISNKTCKIDFKRNNIMNHHMHKISRWIIDYCVENDINTICVGANHDWQRNSNLGKKTNQKFVQIPFTKFIQKLEYKAKDAGIKLILTEERYTSKASFIDNDGMNKEFKCSGKRVNRGLYRSADGTLINADVNGSYNILRKCNPEFKYDGIKGLSLNPVRVNLF